MREILFRGKRIDNGEWVEGDFIAPYFISAYQNGEFYINGTYVNGKSVDGIVWGEGSFYRIAPPTVGQYTGLKDKNGNRVFDGDILQIAKISDGLGGYYQPPLDYPVNVVVKWDLCAWMWETLCEDKRYISFPDAWCHYECEIIGNITDNPELLEK